MNPIKWIILAANLIWFALIALAAIRGEVLRRGLVA